MVGDLEYRLTFLKIKTPWITDLDFMFDKYPRYYIVDDVILYFSNDYYEALNRVLQCQTQSDTTVQTVKLFDEASLVYPEMKSLSHYIRVFAKANKSQATCLYLK